MSPTCKSKVISLEHVPLDDLQDESVDSPRPVVLVVDDEPLVADTLSAILRRAGISARAAYNGPSALVMAAQLLPELLIADVSMPQMTGVELAMMLVSEQPKCKVLLFSGHATSADLLVATEAGHDFPLLSKPMHPNDLLEHIAQMLDRPELSFSRKAAPSQLSAVKDMLFA